jgi:hypothetical protein
MKRIDKVLLGLLIVGISFVGLLYCFAFTDTLDSAVNLVSRSTLEVREVIEERLGVESNTKKGHRCSSDADRKELDKIIGEVF